MCGGNFFSLCKLFYHSNQTTWRFNIIAWHPWGLKGNNRLSSISSILGKWLIEIHITTLPPRWLIYQPPNRIVRPWILRKIGHIMMDVNISMLIKQTLCLLRDIIHIANWFIIYFFNPTFRKMIFDNCQTVYAYKCKYLCLCHPCILYMY